MSKKIDYCGLKLEIHYDPIGALYYCGIPGYTIPTVYVGNTEKDVQDSVEDVLSDYIDFCRDQGSCHETEIGYDALEAYSSGWIVREINSQPEQRNFQRQMKNHLDNKEIEELISSFDENHPDHSEILSSSKEWNKATEQLSDLSESLQHMRMGLIKLAKETGRDHVRGGGMEVFKVKRIGIQEIISR